MRLLIATAISTLLLISGAFAQSNSPSDTPSERAKSETQELEKARSEAQRGNSMPSIDRAIVDAAPFVGGAPAIAFGNA